MNVKIVKLQPDAQIPHIAHVGDVGCDLYTVESYVLKPGERKLFKTGLAMQPEDGYELQIRPRSGLALKHGITVLNSPATVEPTYRGEIMVILYNASEQPYEVHKGDRIAQGVFKRYETVSFAEVNELDDSTRASGGFGSSGR